MNFELSPVKNLLDPRKKLELTKTNSPQGSGGFKSGELFDDDTCLENGQEKPTWINFNKFCV